MGLERRGCVFRRGRGPTKAIWQWEEPMDKAKPQCRQPNIGSRVNREVHARFWEHAEVKSLRVTRQRTKRRLQSVD
jgi:hypothetical protein